MKKKRIALILASLTAIALLITLTACGNGNSASETESDVSSFEETSSAESTLNSETESEINSEAPIENVEEPTEQPAEQAAEPSVNTTTNNTNNGGQTNTGNNTTYTPPSNGNINTGGNNGGNTNTGTATKPQQQQQQTNAPVQPQNHAPIYTQQWVVDQEAWTEYKEIYETKHVSICNTCGADITGNERSHVREHALNDEGGSHHTEPRQVLIGTQEVYHKETGHWESVLVCNGCTGTH